MQYTEFLTEHLDAAAALEAFAPEPWTRAQLQEELCCRAARLYAAVDESGSLCGFCAFVCAAGEANLNAITVAPRHRRKGVARGLLSYALTQLNADEIYLEVRAQNEGAIALYKSLGFCKCGERRGFYKAPPDNAIIMKLV